MSSPRSLARRRGPAVATALLVALGLAAALDTRAEPPASAPEFGLTEAYGMEMPRPVDAESRAALGYAPPRLPDVILAEIDDLTARMRPIADENDVWKERWLEYRAMQRERIALVSELEEAGYDGPRLEPLLLMKLEDVRGVFPLRGRAALSYQRLRDEVAKRHPDALAGAQARADALLDYVHVMSYAGLRVHPDDYPRLAKAELARRDQEIAGILILEALHGERRRGEKADRGLRIRWENWMVENLDPVSVGYRSVMRERGFDQPIRLQGEGLDGEPIDTEAWKGDVILVDFWGTWCVPCIAVMPKLAALRDKYADRGLRVMGVLCDHEREKAQRFLAERGYDWPQLVDPALDADNPVEHRVARKYAVGAFPTLWIIDRKGVLRERIEDGQYEEAVKRYLDEE